MGREIDHARERSFHVRIHMGRAAAPQSRARTYHRIGFADIVCYLCCLSSEGPRDIAFGRSINKLNAICFCGISTGFARILSRKPPPKPGLPRCSEASCHARFRKAPPGGRPFFVHLFFNVSHAAACVPGAEPGPRKHLRRFGIRPARLCFVVNAEGSTHACC